MKKYLSLRKLRSSLRRFHKRTFLLCICIVNIATGIFNIKPRFFQDCKHPLFSRIFHFKRTFFRGLFYIKSYWNQKKSLKITKVLNFQDFVSRDFFISRTYFLQDFLSAKYQDFFRKLFSKNIFGGYTFMRLYI